MGSMSLCTWEDGLVLNHNYGHWHQDSRSVFSLAWQLLGRSLSINHRLMELEGASHYPAQGEAQSCSVHGHSSVTGPSGQVKARFIVIKPF